MQLYDRIAAGDRIRQRRLLLGMTQEELAEKIGRAYKYCQDIERGSCGIVALRTKRKIFSYKIQKPLLKRNLKKDA